MIKILILRGVFPLNKKIILSKECGIEIDNPKTESEIEYVRQYVESRNWKNIFTILEKQIAKNEELRKIFSNGHSLRPSSVEIAKNWLIVRFDDSGLTDELEHRRIKDEAKRSLGLSTFLVLPSNSHLGLKNREQAIYLTNIIGLLFSANLNNSPQRSIIEDQKPLKSYTHDLFRFQFTLIRRGMFDMSTIGKRIEEIKKLCESMDKLNPERKEKLLFVGEILSSVNENHDLRTKLIFLTSILEFLLTHNPALGSSDDSIGRQIRLKAGILISKELKRQLADVGLSLKDVYDLRSNIAHGNFKELNKFIKKKGERGVNIIIEEMFQYVQVVVFEYIYNPDFIDDLKKL